MASPSQIHLLVVAPNRTIVDERVDEAQIPGSEGYFGVLPGHTPLLATLGVGELWYRQGSTTHYIALALGFVEVMPDRVTIMTQVAERAQEIDIARAEAAKRRAEERLARPHPELDFERARVALMKSLIRLRVAETVRIRS